MTFEVDPKDVKSPEARPSTGEMRSGGERSEPERSGSPGVARPDPVPDPEVPEKATRRRFTAQYKLRILKQADACKGKPGALGKLLRREGLYSSLLSAWRRQRKQGELRALSPKKRGRKTSQKAKKSQREKELERENRRLKRRLEKVELMLDIQKKTSELLGIPLSGPGSGEND
jgi:transposase-like protein